MISPYNRPGIHRIGFCFLFVSQFHIVYVCQDGYAQNHDMSYVISTSEQIDNHHYIHNITINRNMYIYICARV